MVINAARLRMPRYGFGDTNGSPQSHAVGGESVLFPGRWERLRVPVSNSSGSLLRLDESAKGRRLDCRQNATVSREWRNWQTHQLEGLAVAIPCRFKSCFPHRSKVAGHRFRGAEATLLHFGPTDTMPPSAELEARVAYLPQVAIRISVGFCRGRAVHFAQSSADELGRIGQALPSTGRNHCHLGARRGKVSSARHAREKKLRQGLLT